MRELKTEEIITVSGGSDSENPERVLDPVMVTASVPYTGSANPGTLTYASPGGVIADTEDDDPFNEERTLELIQVQAPQAIAGEIAKDFVVAVISALTANGLWGALNSSADDREINSDFDPSDYEYQGITEEGHDYWYNKDSEGNVSDMWIDSNNNGAPDVHIVITEQTQHIRPGLAIISHSQWLDIDLDGDGDVLIAGGPINW